MKYAMKHIGGLLKDARMEKGLSQQALSLKVGLPQGHLSKIERGMVDLQAANLIELARALDLELMLIPRILVNTVEALKRGMHGEANQQRPMYQLDEDEDENEE